MEQAENKFDSIDCCFTTALALLCFGIIFACLGLVLGGNYKFDSTLPARKMEERDKSYQRLYTFTSMADVIGVVLIVTGFIILFFAIIGMLMTGDSCCCVCCDKDPREEERVVLEEYNRAQEKLALHLSKNIFESQKNKHRQCENSINNQMNYPCLYPQYQQGQSSFYTPSAPLISSNDTNTYYQTIPYNQQQTSSQKNYPYAYGQSFTGSHQPYLFSQPSPESSLHGYPAVIGRKNGPFYGSLNHVD